MHLYILYVIFSYYCPYAAVEDLQVQQNGNSTPPLKNIIMKQDEIIKEPSMSSLQNFLFYFPGIYFSYITFLGSFLGLWKQLIVVLLQFYLSILVNSDMIIDFDKAKPKKQLKYNMNNMKQPMGYIK